VDAGSRIELHSSAPGKATLAFLPQSEREEILGRMKMPRFNERTITQKGRFRKELKRVQTQGYAVDHGEELEGVHCVGAPIFNERGYPIASIWITGPGDRMPQSSFEALGDQVMEHANRISQRFGYNLL